MKLAFSTLSCPTWSWETIIEEAERNGYDGIEVRGIEEEMYLPKALPFLKENQEETLKELSDRGLYITDLGSSVSFHDPEKYNDSIKEGMDYIDLAEEMKVPYIRIFGNKIPDLNKKNETLELIIKGINELCKYAISKNVSCLLETHGDIVDLETLMPIIDKIEHDNFGIIWDVGHTYKVYGNDIIEFLDKTFQYIKHVHIKDYYKDNGEFKLCMIGEGTISLVDIISILKNRDYKGYISLEWEKRWVESLEEPEVVVPFYAEYFGRYV